MQCQSANKIHFNSIANSHNIYPTLTEVCVSYFTCPDDHQPFALPKILTLHHLGFAQVEYMQINLSCQNCLFYPSNITSGYLSCPTISNNILVWEFLLIVRILEREVQTFFFLSQGDLTKWPWSRAISDHGAVDWYMCSDLGSLVYMMDCPCTRAIQGCLGSI